MVVRVERVLLHLAAADDETRRSLGANAAALGTRQSMFVAHGTSKSAPATPFMARHYRESRSDTKDSAEGDTVAEC